MIHLDQRNWTTKTKVKTSNEDCNIPIVREFLKNDMKRLGLVIRIVN